MVYQLLESAASDTAKPQEAPHVTFDAQSQFPPSFYDRSPLGDTEKVLCPLALPKVVCSN
jgi:hypothetical protein